MKHHYEVTGSLPPKPERQWRTNRIAHVVAPNAKRAIELVEALHPGIEVFTVLHRGHIDIIEDDQ
jgi:hypothetical protein